jgi:hypothetical protein
MNRNRSILATTAFAFGVILAACSSGPENEVTGATAEQILIEHCPIGQQPSCTGKVCTCVPLQPVCTPLPSNDAGAEGGYVEAWAVVTRDGYCPPMPDSIDGVAQGTWAQIGTVPTGFSAMTPAAPGYTSGVPNDLSPTSPSCTSAFPAPAYPTCCTYVWWPIGFPGGYGQALQDPAALCNSNTAELEPITRAYFNAQTDCVQPDGGYDGGCYKGSEDCPTCQGSAK